MSLTNIKSNNQGFTIVELLIVVVVIAILAAITIVSYNGITTRANQSASKSLASSVQKKAELYNSELGRYPITTAELTGATSDKSYALAAPTATTGTFGPTGSVNAADPTSTNGKTTARLYVCAAGAANLAAVTTSNISGIRIAYWDFGASGTPAVAYIDLGSNVASGTCYPPTS